MGIIKLKILESALSEIDGISIVKQGSVKGFDQAFVINVRQPLDHSNPKSKTFEQRVYLSHKGFDKPIVFEHAGYGLSRQRGHELAEILDANFIKIEYRYYGESNPDTLDYKYLNSVQGLADHHKIIEILKSVYSGKVIGTGYSKGGASVMSQYRHYTSDFDAIVVYDAPVTYGKEDQRTHSVGTKEERTRVLAYQRECLKNRDKIVPYFNEKAKQWNTGCGKYITVEQAVGGWLTEKGDKIIYIFGE